MASKFEVQIVGVDRATATFKQVNASAKKIFGPLGKSRRQLDALSRETDFEGMSKGIKKASIALGSFSKISESLGVRSPLFALFGGGIGAGVAGFAAMMNDAAKQASVISRFTQAHGMAGRDLQRLQGAAGLRGIDRDAATSAIGGFGVKLNDVLAGRDQEGRMLLNRVGVRIGRNADGSPDTAAAIADLAEAVKSQRNPEAAGALISRMGLEALNPLLREGAAGVRRLGDETERLGGVVSTTGVKSLTDFDRAIDRLGLSLRGLQNYSTQVFGPLMTSLVDMTTSSVNRTRTEGIAKSLFGAVGGGLGFNPIGMLGHTARFLFGGDPGSQRTGGGTVTDAADGPAGIRGNNPGNLRSWGGVQSVGGFAQFSSPTAGLSAMARQIGLYANRDGINTISGILGKYAPPSENNTRAYIDDVAKRTGFDPNAALNVNDPKVMAPLLSAMVRHEQGRQPFSDAELNRAATQLQVEVVITDGRPQVSVKRSDGVSVPTRVAYAMPASGVR